MALPYDKSNPLTFCHGACQVKDLPADERDLFVNSFHEKQRTIAEQVTEFTFKSRKIAKKLEDMTDFERKQWMLFLEHDDAEISDEGFFNEAFEEFQGYNDQIYIDIWEWNHEGDIILITDMYGWPGDNQSGAVFIGMDMIFENSDTHLDFPRISIM